MHFCEICMIVNLEIYSEMVQVLDSFTVSLHIPNGR